MALHDYPDVGSVGTTSRLGAKGARLARMSLASLEATAIETQIAFPSSDISAGGWIPSSGTDLFATLNDESDATYITGIAA